MLPRCLVAVVLAGIVAASGLACSSTPDVDDEKPTEGPTFDTLAAFEAASAWLPRESSVVVAATDPEDRALIERAALPTVDPEASPGDPGTTEALRADLEELFVEHIGFNTGETEAIVVGAHLNGATVVLLGDFEEPRGLERVEIGDREVFEFYLDDGEIDDVDPVSRGYILVVDGPRNGLVMTNDRDQLKRLIDGQGEAGPGPTRRDGERGELFGRLLDETSGSSLAVAASLRGVGPLLSDENRPLPEAAVFDYGQHAGLTMEGPDEDLERIDERVDKWIAEQRKALKKRYNDRSDEGLAGEVSAIYGYHGLESIAGQLDGEWEDRRLRYEIEVTEMNWGAVAMVGMSIIAGLWDLLGPLDEFVPPTEEWTPREVELDRPLFGVTRTPE